MGTWSGIVPLQEANLQIENFIVKYGQVLKHSYCFALLMMQFSTREFVFEFIWNLSMMHSTFYSVIICKYYKKSIVITKDNRKILN